MHFHQFSSSLCSWKAVLKYCIFCSATLKSTAVTWQRAFTLPGILPMLLWCSITYRRVAGGATSSVLSARWRCIQSCRDCKGHRANRVWQRREHNAKTGNTVLYRSVKYCHRGSMFGCSVNTGQYSHLQPLTVVGCHFNRVFASFKYMSSVVLSRVFRFTCVYSCMSSFSSCPVEFNFILEAGVSEADVSQGSTH